MHIFEVLSVGVQESAIFFSVNQGLIGKKDKEHFLKSARY